MDSETRTFYRTPKGGKLHIRRWCRRGLVPVELTVTEWAQNFQYDTLGMWIKGTVCAVCWYSLDKEPRPLIKWVEGWQWVGGGEDE